MGQLELYNLIGAVMDNILLGVSAIVSGLVLTIFTLKYIHDVKERYNMSKAAQIAELEQEIAYLYDALELSKEPEDLRYYSEMIEKYENRLSSLEASVEYYGD